MNRLISKSVLCVQYNSIADIAEIQKIVEMRNLKFDYFITDNVLDIRVGNQSFILQPTQWFIENFKGGFKVIGNETCESLYAVIIEELA